MEFACIQEIIKNRDVMERHFTVAAIRVIREVFVKLVINFLRNNFRDDHFLKYFLKLKFKLILVIAIHVILVTFVKLCRMKRTNVFQ